MSRTTPCIQKVVALGSIMSGLLACQTPPPSSAQPIAAATTAPATAATVEPTTEPIASATPSVTATASAAPPADTRVHDACAKLCERKSQACSDYQEATCQAECRGREERSTGCETEVEAALLCQATAKQSPCNNVAAGACTEPFLQMRRCKHGEKTEIASSASLPDGWETFRDEAWGVSMVMPQGARASGEGKSRTWKASKDGVDYEVRELARPKDLTENALIKLVIAHVGVSCQKEMRLTGRVELPNLMFTRYETGCSKDARMYGKLRIDGDRALSLLVRGPAKSADVDAFLDGVR